MDWGILTEGGPSHLIPAAGVLFEPLIKSLLGISDGHSTSHNRGQKKGSREDIEMEDVQEQPPREITRDVTGGEMDMLVELFKSTEFTSAFSRFGTILAPHVLISHTPQHLPIARRRHPLH